MAEYKTESQTNTPIAVSFESTKKAPIIAKTIWATKEEMLEYVNNSGDTATPGLLLTVISDEVEINNGVYLVRRVGDGIRNGVVRQLSIEEENYDDSVDQMSAEIEEDSGDLLITEADNSLIEANLTENGELIIDYPDNTGYEFSIDENGELIANII